MNLLIVIPAFNEAQVIERVLTNLPKSIAGINNLSVLVINDGSTDDTSKIAQKCGAIVIDHLLNRGAGAATRTGFEYALKYNFDVLVTFDADGQHNPDDIKKLIHPIMTKNADLVIGSRLKEKQKMPTDRLFINWIANLTTLAFFGVFSTDSQSGLRAFSRKAIEKIDIVSDRMEFSSEILLEAKRNNLKVTEVPVRALYSVYSKMKGQKNINALPIFFRIVLKLLR